MVKEIKPPFDLDQYYRNMHAVYGLLGVPEIDISRNLGRLKFTNPRDLDPQLAEEALAKAMEHLESLQAIANTEVRDNILLSALYRHGENGVLVADTLTYVVDALNELIRPERFYLGISDLAYPKPKSWSLMTREQGVVSFAPADLISAIIQRPDLALGYTIHRTLVTGLAMGKLNLRDAEQTQFLDAVIVQHAEEIELRGGWRYLTNYILPPVRESVARFYQVK